MVVSVFGYDQMTRIRFQVCVRARACMCHFVLSPSLDWNHEMK